MRRTLLHLIGVALCASLAGAQTVLYQTAFDDDSGWTLEGCWSVDADPVISGGIAHSGSTSLNCTEPGGGYSSCYDVHATSPLVDLASGLSGTALSFWCRWQTFEEDCLYDSKHLNILDAAGTSILAEHCFEPATTCPDHLEWHEHSIALDPSWGSVHLDFWFDVEDEFFNGGCTPTIFTTGVPSYSGSGVGFRVHAQNVLNKHPGLMIWSLAAGSTPFGGGTLCLGGSVKRTAGQASGGNPTPPTDCSGAYAFTIGTVMMAAEGLTPGTDVFVQYWSRDTGFSAPDTMGLTAGVQFTVCD